MRDRGGGGAILAAFVGPGAPDSYGGLPHHAKGPRAPQAGRDAAAPQTAVGRRDRSLSRIGRVARQGRRLCDPGPCRRICAKAYWVLFRGGRTAAIRDHVAACRRRLSGACYLVEQGITAPLTPNTGQTMPVAKPENRLMKNQPEHRSGPVRSAASRPLSPTARFVRNAAPTSIFIARSAGVSALPP